MTAQSPAGASTVGVVRGRSHLLSSFTLLLCHGLYRELFLQSWERLFGTVTYVRLRSDVESFAARGHDRVTLVARRVEARDHQILSGILSDRSVDRHERHEAVRRLVMLAEDVDTCYVVEDLQGNVRFLQWLMLPAENDKRQKTFGDWYPTLLPGEAMVESAYVIPRFRYTGILATGVARIVEIAKSKGVKHILTIVPVWNVNSLKSFVRLGFRPYQIVRERRFFGSRRRQAVDLDAGSSHVVKVLGLPLELQQILVAESAERSASASR